MADKAKRAALIGYDCLIPKRLEAMLAQGGLEHFRAFMNEGSFIPEGYNLPTVTPPSWATICTGAYPRTHGVEDYYYYHEGRSLDYKETTQAFGSDIVTAETIWDAWDKNGKKCIVVNYPMSWPSRMKNGVMIMGQGLSPAETRWPLHGNEHKEFLASESVISTEFYPMGVQGTFDDAKGWKNLPECDEPLEMVVNMAFKECVEPVEGQTWYCLAWESGDDGYDRIALCPEKDYSKAFFTIRLGEWSEPVQHDFTIKADGRTEKGVFRCKLMQLSDDAEEFKLYISGIAGRIGFIAPPEAADQIDFSKHITANDIGLVAFLHGIIDTDTVCELVEFHSAWLWNTVESLLKANPDWDLFYMHSHPIDWFYHGWLSELDSKDPEIRARAEKMERHIYEVEDRLLGRLMDIMGDDTLMCVCSDHGATPMGPILNTAHALKQAGLCSYEPKKSENYWDIYEETEGFNYVLDVSKSLAVPQRYMFVYVNLKGKYRRARGLREGARPDHRCPARLQASRDRRAARAPRGTQGRRACLRHGRRAGGRRGVRPQARVHGGTRLRPAHRRIRLRQPQEPPHVPRPEHQEGLPLHPPALAGGHRAHPLLHDRRPGARGRRRRAHLPDHGRPQYGEVG